MVTKFRSAEAEAGWNKFKELWQYTNPASTNYDFMQEPLLTGDVWVAFDHVARLADAFNQQPDDFVAFPAPAGPTGRGFMPVLAGIARAAGRARHGHVQGAGRVHDAARDAGRDAARHQLLPGDRRRTLPDDLPASAQASRPGDRRA